MESVSVEQLPVSTGTESKGKTPFYFTFWFQVLVAVALAICLGYFSPAHAIAMKPLGDGFIRLITMIITPIIFCTVVSGIAGMQDLRKVGRVGGKALLYFEVVSTIALLIGLVVGNVVHPGGDFRVDPASLDAKAVSSYVGQTKAMGVTDFLMHIIPITVVDAFAKGDILQVLLVALLFGFALSSLGQRATPLLALLNTVTQAVFAVVNLLVRLAPIGAFGAMAFTVGKYGIASLGPLLKLIATFYLTSIFFVVVVLGGIALVAGFNIFRFLIYIKEEILLVLSVVSSEAAMPTLMEKLEAVGCSKALVGLVVPTGYIFNTDGTALYMTLAALFVAQATGTHLTLMQQLTIFAVAILTSKGASGVQGASFIALVATLSVVPTIPVAGMALILGIDRFMAMFRAVVNMIGSGVATLVIARWENEVDAATLGSRM
ncbi:C4-dicarboxylate transporter DctA [Tunturiibacter gelidoferens]|uniref:Aerobic C4-dicarboxylate transport protein n=1 Tax=Tunturiibacter gelidiferens TaxID=3069689 RepID=A0ACC5P451_9BACT|nr:C4-dicarboxylate transporter DctA [Edaphobacter lichenicola]MBB5341572.1 aerobic C4-dicarboxylate transport protein [Edaphobacter lichenicola]